MVSASPVSSPQSLAVSPYRPAPALGLSSGAIRPGNNSYATPPLSASATSPYSYPGAYAGYPNSGRVNAYPSPRPSLSPTFSPSGSASQNAYPGGLRPSLTNPAYNNPWGNAVPGTNYGVNVFKNSLGRPLTPQEMGSKIGVAVSNFLQENPLLLDKLNQFDVDSFAQDAGPKIETLRAKLQQALKPIPQSIDRRLIRIFDPEMQQLATDFQQWLRKDPDAATLAKINEQKANNALAIENGPKDSFWQRSKAKMMNIWPFNRNKPAQNDDTITDQELQALLNGLSLK